MAGAISRACVPPNMPPLGGGDKLVKFGRLYRDSLKVGDWFITLPKTNMEGPKMMGLGKGNSL